MSAIVTNDAELLALAHAMTNLEHPVKVATSTWAAEHLARHDRVEADHQSRFASDDWKRLADHGLMKLMVSTEAGGSGANLATSLLTLEGLGHGCRDNGLNYALGSQILSTQVALERFGTPDQQQRWLAPLLTGDLFVAFGMTEPEAGSDAYSLTTSAERLDDGSYKINGHKAYITFGSRFDMALVFATTNPTAGQWGISAFLVPADLPGVERVGNRDKMGMRTTPFGDMTFTDVIVPADAVLGRPGSGASIFAAVLEVERSFVFITQVGAMQRQIEDTIEFANTRIQGGEPISARQVIAHRIVNMKERHETARLFVYKAAMATVTGTHSTMASALAKIAACDVGIASALDAASVHGARGYVSEYEVERELRDAVGGLVYSGTSDIQRNIVARLLGIG
ncbi:MAG: alkylation response protein AidB-like acyl-CoA dehydrogenase [Ilumatobacter sp.]|jgi:alkylation response protein AidB-like acyl-CoA dehydrogenase